MNEDLIRRSDVLNLATCITKPTYDSPYCESVVYVEDIEAIPSIDAGLTRHGEWEWKDGAAYCTAHKGKTNPYLCGYGYCPLCGAKMDGGADNGR